MRTLYRALRASGAVTASVVLALSAFPLGGGVRAQAPEVPPSSGPALTDPDDPFQALRRIHGLTIPGRFLMRSGDRGTRSLVEFDPEGGRLLLTRRVGLLDVTPPVPLDAAEFTSYAVGAELWRSWARGSTRVAGEARNAENEGILNVSLPFSVPFTERIFGKGAPNLRVTGSERITLSGTSSWTVGQKDTERGRSSIFPKLDMRQQLNVNLRGTIGTKLSVDIAQNSEALTPLENAIKIRYKGEEDEMLRSVELGNTNLSLPATQYVSFSARQEGLFGVKAEAKVGDVGLTAIASRQEGEAGSATLVGGSEEQSGVIRDIDAVRGKYFFVADPDSAQFPIVVPGTIRVFLDDRNKLNDNELNAVPATVTLDPRFPEVGPSYTGGKFHELNQETEFNVYNERAYALPVLVLRNPLSNDHTLAIAYQESVTVVAAGVRVTTGEIREVGAFTGADQDTVLELKMLRPALDLWGTENLIASPWAPVRRMELKNYYSLRSRNIDRESFTLQISRNGGNNEPFLTAVRDGRRVEIPLIQILGLDQRNNQTGQYVPDGRVDEEYIDYADGILFFPDLRPFDPSVADIAGSGHLAMNPAGETELRGRSRSWPVTGAARPDTLGWEGGLVPSSADVRSQQTAPAIYDLRIDRLQNQPGTYTRFNIEATFRTTVSTMQLGNVGRILEGSETVRLNGQILQRGVDYTIVYETGELVLKNPDATNPGADLTVTYSYDSPLSRGSRSLVGASLAYQGESNYTYSTSWLRESRGIPETRPRLGQEPTTTTVGDFSGAVRFQPWGLTRLMDGLPLVDTAVPSRVELSGALGLSFPDPNTRDQVYVDDMEGAEVINSAALNRRNWFYSSPPASFLGIRGPESGVLRPALPGEGRGKLLWYSPTTVRQEDLRPNLEEFEANDYVSVLEVLYVPDSDVPEADAWGGLVTGLGRTGANLAEAQYLEVWINDFVPHDRRDDPLRGRRGELRIDLGAVSEDGVWDPRVPPLPANGNFDFEDRNENGGLIEADEDVGLDLIPDAREVYDPDRDGGSPTGDRVGDNRRDEVGEPNRRDTAADKFRKFDGINGTEDNQDSDTEDANLNDRFDLDNDYFEYAVDLASEAFLDVTRDFPNVPEAERNGWRLYRIPLTDPARHQVGLPDLTTAKHIRFWFRGVAPGDTLNVQIAALEVVGNRWERLPVVDRAGREIPAAELEAQGSVFNIAVVNNKDNQNEYTPPFPVERRDRVTEREQSLSLEFEGFQDGHEFRAYRSFVEPRDFTLYRELAFYLQPRLDPADSVEFFIRFGSNASTDTLTYYEVATVLSEGDPRRRGDGWVDVRLDVAALSSQKVDIPVGTEADSFVVGPDDVTSPVYGSPPRADAGNGLKLTVRGQPSFSQVRRLTVGLRNRAGETLVAGRVWFDELRIGAVRRDNGWIGRTAASVTLADVLSFSAQASLADEDFVRLGQARGSGAEDLSYNLGAQFNAHKLVEDLGVQAPVKLNTRRTRRTPKFFANSDVEFTGANTGRDVTESGQDDLAVQLSRTPRGRSPFLLRYTVDALRMNAQVSSSFNNGVSQVDTTDRRQIGVNYSLTPNVPPLRVLGALEFSPVPRTVSLAWNWGRSERRAYARDRNDPTLLKATNLDTTDTGTLQIATTMSPFRSVTYTFSSQRDLVDENFRSEVVRRERPARSFFGVDLGREVAQNQSLNASYTPPFGGSFRPRLTWSGSFNQTYGPTLTRDDYSAAARNISNSNNLNLTMTLPLGRMTRGLFGGGSAGATPSSSPAADTAARRKEEREEHEARMLEIQRRQTEEARRARAAMTDSLAAVAPDTVGTAPPAEPGGATDIGPPAAGGAAPTVPEKPSRPLREELRDLFTRVVTVGDVQLNGGYQRRNALNGVSGSPGVLYQLGIVTDPRLGEDVFPITDQSGSKITTETDGRNTNYRAGTSVTLFRKVGLDFNYQKRIDRSSTGGGTTNSVKDDTTWPEVRIEWGDLHRRVPLVGKLFSEFKAASSSYSRTTSESGTEANPRQQVTVTTNWRPLIRLEGTLQGGWRARFGLDKTSSESRAERPGIPSNANLRGTTTVTAAFNRAFARKGKDGSNRSIDFAVDISYSRNDNRTVDGTGRVIQSRENDNLQVRNSATLRFTRTVSGTFGLNLGQQRDVTSDRTTRSIGISFATGFNF